MLTLSLLVDLDSLLDTRLSLINRHVTDKESFNSIMASYSNRLSDTFEKLPEFSSLYSNRTNDTLKDCAVTNMLLFIEDYLKTFSTSVNEGPFKYDTNILLNIHPYDLKKDEVDMLCDFLSKMFNFKCEVRWVNISIKDLTPEYLKINNIITLIMYTYVDWLEEHIVAKNFDKHPCSDIKLFGPRVYFSEVPDTRTLTKDPFESIELITSPYIDLSLLPIREFNSVLVK